MVARVVKRYHAFFIQTIFVRDKVYTVTKFIHNCAADFSLLNLPKGKSLGHSKPATNS